MRKLRVGQVWCSYENKKYETTIIFLTKKNVVAVDLDGEEYMMSHGSFIDNHVFVCEIRLKQESKE